MMYVRSMLFGLLCLLSVSCVQDSKSSLLDSASLSSNPQTIDLKRPNSSLYFLNASRGWVILKGKLYVTSDSGSTWEIVNRSDLAGCQSVSFASETTGWALCDLWNSPRRSNIVLASRDGGISWQQVLEVPTPIYSVDFLDENIGFVSRRWLPLLRTSDGGRTWTEVDGIEGLNYVFFVDKTKGWGYGGAIWYTEDSGQNWLAVTQYDQTEDLWNADFANGNSGWIVGRNQVWQGSNSQAWRQIKTVPEKLDFLSVAFVDSMEGWISASDGSLFHTSDGGSNWRVIARLAKPLGTIRFIKKNAGWATDSNGNLLFSRDGGINWNKLDLDK